MKLRFREVEWLVLSKVTQLGLVGEESGFTAHALSRWAILFLI